MKIGSTSVLGLILGSKSTLAWLPPRTTSTKTRLTSTSLIISNKYFAPLPNHGGIFTPSTKLFSSTAVPVEPDAVVEIASLPPTAALEPTGKAVSEGSIIAAFPGGVTVVQVNDDTVKVAPTSAAAKTLPTFTPDSPPKVEIQTTSNTGDDMLGRQVLFPNGKVGVVIAERAPIVFCLTESNFCDATDETVQVLNSMADIHISDQMRCVDCFGRPLDNAATKSTTITSTSSRAIFAPIPKVKDIALINNPMLTGTTMIDALAPIGKGQNMLVVGHDLKQMRGFARDFFATQLREGRGTKCIYAITQNREEVMDELRKAGLLDDVIVVSTRKDSLANQDEVSTTAEAVTVAAAACAIAESYAFQGMNSLVVVDTIDQHKTFWDATTRVLVDVYGVDAVVQSDREGGASSEMRGFFSSLIQRSSQYKERLGSGSLTLALLTTIPSLRITKDDEDSRIFSVEDFVQCSDKIKNRLDMLVKKNIPLTCATLRKIQIPIPSLSEGQRRLVLQHVDDLISMSDGQIWLDETLEEKGQRPPVDPQKSVTRIGIGADTESRADAPAIRKVVEGLRLDLAQAANMDGADASTKAFKRQALKRNAWLLAMHQEAGQGGRSLSESCTALLAASKGYLDGTIEKGGLAGTAMGQAVVKNLLQYVQSVATDAATEIDKTLDMSPEALDAIDKAIQSYFAASQ